MYLIPESEFFSIGIKAIWDKIVKKGIAFDIGQQYEYCAQWWAIYKNAIIKKELLLLLDFLENPSSVWPMMIRRQYMLNGIHIIGQIDGMITDYAFPIVSEPKHFVLQLIEVVRTINKKKIEWNYLKINIPEWSGYLKNYDNIKEILSKEKLYWYTKEYDKYSYIQLPNNFDTYLLSLGSKTRADIRKFLRIFDSDKFIFKIVQGAELLEVYTKMLELNIKTWTIFSGTNNQNHCFIEALIQKESDISNGKIIMPVLLYEDKVLAATLGYIYDKRCFLHTAGVQRSKIQSLSPGITLYALLIRKLIEMSINMLDLSPGIEDYKLRLNGQVQTIDQIVIFKNRISKIVYKSSLCINNARKWIRALTS